MIKTIGFNYDVMYFPCGEMHVKIKNYELKRINKKSKNAIIEFTFERNEEIIELMLLANAIKHAGLKLDDIFIPYIPFSRQDRISCKGEAFSLEVFADIINSLDAKRVYVDDPHSDVSTALIKNCIVRTQADIFKKSLVNKRDFYLISPDGGALKKTYKLAEEIGNCIVIECSKIRDVKTGKITETKVYYDDFGGKDCVIVDDICDGGRTMIEISKVLKQKNAGKIIMMVTHCFMTKGIEVFDNLIDEIYSKNGRIK